MRNRSGMISGAGVVGDAGILALAHGYNDKGNQQWMAKFTTVSREYPTGYALGMAMMSSDHIQQKMIPITTATGRNAKISPCNEIVIITVSI